MSNQGGWTASDLEAFAANLKQRTEDLNSATAQLLHSENILEKLLKTLDKNIKKDYVTKLSVLFTGISAFLREPLNLFIRGASGSGKTYNTTKVLEFFPQEAILFLGGLSPTALIHDHGVKMAQNGLCLDKMAPPEKPQRSSYETASAYADACSVYRNLLQQRKELEKTAYNLIELTGKTLVFLETPHIKTFNILRPILSHDKEEISFKIADKNAAGSLETKTVVIKGFPAAIFLKATDEYAEELATRSFTTSPSSSTDKFRLANQLTDRKANEPWFEDEQTRCRCFIGYVLSQIRDFCKDKDVIIPFKNLSDFYPHDLPRDMRDYAHLTQFTKCITALFCKQRVIAERKGNEYIVSSIQDVALAWLLFSSIFETTRTGVSANLLEFYHRFVEKQESWLVKDLVTAYNRVNNRTVSDSTIRNWLETLSQIGYVSKIKNPEDGRSWLYTPLIFGEQNLFDKGRQTTLDSLPEVQEKSEITSIQQNHVFSEANLQKKADSYLYKYCSELRFYKYVNNEKVEIDFEEAKKIVYKNPELTEYLNTVFADVKNENKPKITSEYENHVISDNSSEYKPNVAELTDVPPSERVTKPCPICHLTKTLTHQVTFTGGAWCEICQNCADNQRRHPK